MTTPTISVSPTGEEFPLPVEADYQAENNRLSAFVCVRLCGSVANPKDGGLGVWSYHTLMGFEDDIFKITPLAIDINDTRALHVAGLVRDGLRNQSKIVAASRVLVLGASYREDVGDTRYSGSELIVRKLTEMGAEVLVHDPYVKHWWELEKQETYPAPGQSWSSFFRNQESLSDLRVSKDLKASLKGVDAVIIDCFAMLSDTQIKTFFAAGYEVKGLGRGHMKRLKEEVAEK